MKDWARHPAFDFALIPDVIDGDEKANDMMIARWNNWDGWRGESWPRGVPVWHLHESLDRLARLCKGWDRVALGSSGKWPTPGTQGWWNRMGEAMEAACDSEGRPLTKLHGLRMLNPAVFHRLPLSSADSTNAVRNASIFSQFGNYIPPKAGGRMSTIADRIESHQSAAIWRKLNEQKYLLFSE